MGYFPFKARFFRINLKYTSLTHNAVVKLIVVCYTLFIYILTVYFVYDNYIFYFLTEIYFLLFDVLLKLQYLIYISTLLCSALINSLRLLKDKIIVWQYH